mmetsp:Transcript_84358/g.133653  ORF Transcript_84358/g.133653 Transcript_84358/m.133653 type:complete len:93 (+) Transcript_84358:1789-2067(+)
MQPTAENAAPTITTDEALGLKILQNKGARTRRLIAKRIQNTTVEEELTEESNPICVMAVISHVPHATSTPTARTPRPAAAMENPLIESGCFG